jgi:hypothetical protein
VTSGRVAVGLRHSSEGWNPVGSGPALARRLDTGLRRCDELSPGLLVVSLLVVSLLVVSLLVVRLLVVGLLVVSMRR